MPLFIIGHYVRPFCGCRTALVDRAPCHSILYEWYIFYANSKQCSDCGHVQSDLSLYCEHGCRKFYCELFKVFESGHCDKCRLRPACTAFY